MDNNKVNENYYASMADLKVKFNSDMKRVLMVIMGFVFVVFTFQYYSMREQALNTLINNTNKFVHEIDLTLDEVENQNNLLKTYAETRFKSYDLEYKDSVLKGAFIYNSEKDIFVLSKGSNIVSFNTAGELVGVGEIDKNNKLLMDELKIALELFDVEYYSSDENSIEKDGFYLSDMEFITVFNKFMIQDEILANNLIMGKDFFYKMYEIEFWKDALPESNKGKIGFWSSTSNEIFNDHKNLVYVEPVYRYKDFKGIIGSKINITELENKIAKENYNNGELYLFTDTGECIVAWDYDKGESIDTESDKVKDAFLYFGENSVKKQKWISVDLDSKPFHVIYKANEYDVLKLMFPNMVMMTILTLAFISFILINRRLLRTRFFSPALKLFEYIKQGSSNIDGEDVIDYKWIPGINDMILVNSISKNISGAIIQIDKDYKISFLSEGLELYYENNLIKEELLGTSIFDIVIKDQRWSIESAFIQSKKFFLPISHECAINNNTEDLTWFSFILSPRKHDDGTISWDGIILDVTDRKVIEEELSNEKKFIEEMLDEAGAIFSVRNRNFKLLRFNKSFLKVSGYSVDEIMTNGECEGNLLGVDYEKVHANFEKIINGEYPLRYENHWISSSGEKRLIRWTNTGLTNKEGEVEYIISAGIDITDKEVAENKLKETLNKLQRSETRFRGIFDNIASGIGLIKLDGSFIEVNDKWTELLGYSKEEALEINVIDITFEDDKLMSQNSLRLTERGKEAPRRMEKRYIRKDGSIIWCDLSISVVSSIDSSDEKVVIGIITDISARKNAEENLLLTNANLEKEKDKADKLAKSQKLVFEFFELFKENPDIKDIFESLQEFLPRVINYRNLMLAVKETKSSKTYIVKDIFGDFEKIDKSVILVDGKGIIGKALRDKTSYVANDLSVDPYYVPHGENLKSMIAAPLVFQDFIWGFIALDSEELNAFDELSHEILTIMTTHIALRLEEVSNKRDLKLEAERLRSLHEVVKEMSVERDNHLIAKKIIEKELFPYTSIYSYGNDEINLIALKSNLDIEVVCSKEMVLKAFDDDSNQYSVFEFNNLNQLIIPIRFGQNKYGIFHICKSQPFSFADYEIASIVSEQLSIFWELNMLIEKTEYEALIDPLTTVWNRRYMMIRLEEEDEYLRRYGGVACVAIIDLGNFKVINDRYGHLKGDEALKWTSDMISKNIRKGDFVGRYGGDEFIVFFPKTTYGKAGKFMSRITEEILKMEIPGISEKVIADYGIASAPNEGESLLGAIKIADERMYENKRNRKRRKNTIT